MIPHHRPMTVFEVVAPAADECTDSSVGSTFEARRSFTTKKRARTESSSISNHYAEPLSRTTRTAATRRVCFDDNANVIHSDYTVDPEDFDNQWYSAQEMKKFKTIYTEQVKAIIQLELKNKQTKNYLPVMTRVFKACCKSSASALGEKDVLSLSSKDRRYFEQWIAVTPSRMGMERLAVRALRMDKTRRRDELLCAILEIQEEQDHHPMMMMDDPQDNVEHLMAQVSRDISAPSRYFATLLAQAQAKQA